MSTCKLFCGMASSHELCCAFTEFTRRTSGSVSQVMCCKEPTQLRVSRTQTGSPTPQRLRINGTFAASGSEDEQVSGKGGETFTFDKTLLALGHENLRVATLVSEQLLGLTSKTRTATSHQHTPTLTAMLYPVQVLVLILGIYNRDLPSTLPIVPMRLGIVMFLAPEILCVRMM